MSSTIFRLIVEIRFSSVSTNKDNSVIDQEGTETYEEETPNKVKKVELEIQSDKEESSVGTNSDVGELTVFLFVICALESL